MACSMMQILPLAFPASCNTSLSRKFETSEKLFLSEHEVTARFLPQCLDCQLPYVQSLSSIDISWNVQSAAKYRPLNLLSSAKASFTSTRYFCGPMYPDHRCGHLAFLVPKSQLSIYTLSALTCMYFSFFPQRIASVLYTFGRVWSR
jgi:hypothetical protein